jgi:anti-anti-sigma factor
MKAFQLTHKLISSDKNEKVLELHLQGELSLYHAAEIRDELLQALMGDYRQVHLQIEEVSALDASFLQILEALKKTLQRSHASLQLRADLPYNLKTLLENAGVMDTGLTGKH